MFHPLKYTNELPTNIICCRIRARKKALIDGYGKLAISTGGVCHIPEDFQGHAGQGFKHLIQLWVFLLIAGGVDQMTVNGPLPTLRILQRNQELTTGKNHTKTDVTGACGAENLSLQNSVICYRFKKGIIKSSFMPLLLFLSHQINFKCILKCNLLLKILIA